MIVSRGFKPREAEKQRSKAGDFGGFNLSCSKFVISRKYLQIFNLFRFFMGKEYVVLDQGAVHFVTFTVHQWVDVFTRKAYSEIFLDSLRYCQENKGLQIFAWVIMSNHAHLILRAKNENLSDIIRDLRKFTAKKIYKAIDENPSESRKKWLKMTLTFENQIWFWEKGYHGEEIYSTGFFETKVKYIHENPVRAGIVEKAEDYLLSSAPRNL